MKNILIITDSYPPEIRSAAQLMKDLADGLRDKGHNVFVATSYPKYNLADSESIVWPEILDENGVRVLRIKTLPHHKANFVIRGIAQLTMPYIFSHAIKKNITEKLDVVILHSPPLPLTIAAYKIKEFYKAKYILNLHDFFPQNAVDLGILTNKSLIKFFEGMEHGAYKKADVIMVPSEAHKSFLIEKRNIPREKIRVVSHWINPQPFLSAERTGKFRKLYGLENKFVFFFGGVLGPSQGLDLIIRLAYKLKDNKDICFLLSGDGTEKEKLMKMVKNYNLTNVIFEPFSRPGDKQAGGRTANYPSLLKDMDVGLLCLSSKNTTPAVPAKILGYMAATVPVVAFLHKESDGLLIVKEAKCGYGAVSNDEEKALEIILKIYNEKEKLKQYGENGRNYLLKNFLIENCLNKIEKIFLDFQNSNLE